MNICEKCGALDQTCCAAAEFRRETANILANIVTRQSAVINLLQREMQELRSAAHDRLNAIGSTEGA